MSSSSSSETRQHWMQYITTIAAITSIAGGARQCAGCAILFFPVVVARLVQSQPGRPIGGVLFNVGRSCGSS